MLKLIGLKGFQVICQACTSLSLSVVIEEVPVSGMLKLVKLT